MFSCASCHTDYFKIAESMYAEDSRCPLCLGSTVPAGDGFVGPNGQFYIGLRCEAYGASGLFESMFARSA